MSQLLDIGHVFGGDLETSNAGDLATVSAVTRSTQRVLRRLLTPPGTYIFHPEYGAGLPKYVGDVVDVAEVTALIIGQMLLEASVIRTPPPEVTVTETTDGISVFISYLVAPDRQPAALSFDVSA